MINNEFKTASLICKHGKNFNRYFFNFFQATHLTEVQSTKVYLHHYKGNTHAPQNKEIYEIPYYCLHTHLTFKNDCREIKESEKQRDEKTWKQAKVTGKGQFSIKVTQYYILHRYNHWTLEQQYFEESHPSNNSKFLQFLNSIIHIKITFLTKLFFDQFFTPLIKILIHIIKQ